MGEGENVVIVKPPLYLPGDGETFCCSLYYFHFLIPMSRLETPFQTGEHFLYGNIHFRSSFDADRSLQIHILDSRYPCLCKFCAFIEEGHTGRDHDRLSKPHSRLELIRGNFYHCWPPSCRA